MPKTEKEALHTVLDVNPLTWGEQERRKVDIQTFLNHVFVFLNSFLTLHRANKLCVILTSQNKNLVVWPEKSGDHQDHEFNFSSMNEAIRNGVLELTRESKEAPQSGPLLPGAVANGLTWLNFMNTKFPELQGRILIFNASEDCASQYVATMNTIFAAQKLEIPIDVYSVLSNGSTSFLEQAAYLTEGIFVRAISTAILQQLLFLFLPSLKTRRTLNISDQKKVDLRASCFCHRQPTDEGYVCVVCLSVFCKRRPSCQTCGTRFPKKIRKKG